MQRGLRLPMRWLRCLPTRLAEASVGLFLVCVVGRHGSGDGAVHVGGNEHVATDDETVHGVAENKDGGFWCKCY